LEERAVPDRGGRRCAQDRRAFDYAICLPERRCGRDRRSGKDRRSGRDRRQFDPSRRSDDSRDMATAHFSPLAPTEIPK
jgi:hypothetical protein